MCELSFIEHQKLFKKKVWAEWNMHEYQEHMYHNEFKKITNMLFLSNTVIDLFINWYEKF